MNEEAKKIHSLTGLHISVADAFKVLSISTQSSSDDRFQLYSPSITFVNNLETDWEYKQMGYWTSVTDVRRNKTPLFIFFFDTFSIIVFRFLDEHGLANYATLQKTFLQLYLL